MKNVLVCPITPPSDRPTSHRGSQATMYAREIANLYDNCDVNYRGRMDSYDNYDVMWVYHGNDWTSGPINLFGGVEGFQQMKNVLSFANFKGKVISIGRPMPDYHEILNARLTTAIEKGKRIPPAWLAIDWDNLARICKTSTYTPFPAPTNKIVIGDSHAICMGRPGWFVNSVPFTTLNGAIKRGLVSYIPTSDSLDRIDHVEMYFGNIDIRHHICRLFPNAYIDAAKDLARRYADAMYELPIDAYVSAYELLPIENESRVVPKTGYHKGQPFWGTWQQRTDARNAFNDTLADDPRVHLMRWTDHLFNDKGELDFMHMEKPRSVHLSRTAYPYED